MFSRASLSGDGICTIPKETTSGNERLAFYMDLVSHDMLNDNQAVLSYLELILEIPGLDEKARAYAKKALSYVRSSTMRIDNVKTVVGARKATAASRGTADLSAVIEECARELPTVFPSKTVKVMRPEKDGKAMVAGGGVIKELLLTVMAGAVKMDPGTDVTLNVSLAEDPGYGKHGWIVTIEDPEVRLPAVVKDANIDAVHTKDKSLASNVSGILFAKLTAEALGGDFGIEPSADKPKGVAFVLKLKGAGR